MRTEIRQSTSTPASAKPWFWRVWENGRMIARGQSASEEEAQQAVRAIAGPEHTGSVHRSSPRR